MDKWVQGVRAELFFVMNTALLSALAAFFIFLFCVCYDMYFKAMEWREAKQENICVIQIVFLAGILLSFAMKVLR
ncbi:hypothetical protein [Wielerella bovis]|uniref:hypothetical protein n=1 Tax=Wielerella bovis TaxID=2917790 RepID=UPI00201A15B1|nr:hypothetical protein [Wielerella bovis]ULJ59723.1 hypothetical protein MIS44_08550 [Wielerella bovis]ULJ64159.1 hypothetical protein MIS33_08340 [Wielerella bovis]ULJ67925.1 hypothetical protein MIS31_05130 [Wielerella bovis]